MIGVVVVVGLGSPPTGAQESTTSTTATTTPTTAAPTSASTATTAAPTSATTAPTAAPSSTSSVTTASTSGSSAATATATTLSEEQRRERARAAGNLNAAKAADSEIAAALQTINEEAQATQGKVDQARRSLEVARSTEETAAAELEASSTQQIAIEGQLRAKAVEGFKSSANDPGIFFTDRSVNQSIRQTQLLQQANVSTAELLEELRDLKEDRRVAQAEAAQAAADAEALEQQLTAELEILQEQQTVQLRLKSEAESRISKWESELSAYAAEDAGIQRLIANSSAETVATPIPRQPSLLGFQWPIVGRVSSPYGYRIHPIYRTRKLHSGLDVAAPRGTPIASTSSGTVIFAGVRGGYGNTVIVDHGGGITSLYAHLSQIGSSEGASVDRGDVIGHVGATGTATGNHLHLEIRVGGEPVDPAPYLP
ncbi:MAG: peptidoglycan DD-metalloendopeptidase family protein [Acidimicrobiales bacterium]